MTSWGGYEGHLRVGIDWTISPSSPSASDSNVSVTWRFYVDSDGWSFDDDETLHYSGTGFGTIDNGFHNGSSGGSILVGSHTETYGISSNSGNVSASTNLTGVYNGATPSHSVTVNLPNRPSYSPPSAGFSPTATNITTTSADISWSPPTDNGGATVDDYQLEVDTSSAFGSPDYNVSANNRSRTVTGLSSNTHYYYRVRAHNSVGWGSWSSTLSFTTDKGGPSTPGTPRINTFNQTSINVGWAASDGNGGGTVTYTCQCATDSAFTNVVQTYTGIAGTNTFTGLTPSTTYYFRVKGTNTGGTSGYSGTGSQATLAPLLYNDSGDYVTLVNNFAAAVGDKMSHLGMSLWRGKVSATTLPNGTDTLLTMGSEIEARGPAAHQPTYIGVVGAETTADFQINYAGTYDIEMAFRFDEAPSGRCNLYIYVNGLLLPSTTVSRAGAATGFPTYGANAQDPLRTFRITRYLQVGDTVGWGLFQSTGASMSQPTPGENSNLYAWGKVTMVGF